MNKFSLFENILLNHNFDEVKSVTNGGCLVKNNAGNSEWNNENGETSGIIKRHPSKIYSTVNGEYACLYENSEMCFYQTYHANPSFSIPIQTADLEEVGQCHIWCEKVPSTHHTYAIIAMITAKKLVVYIYEKDEVVRYETPSSGIKDFVFVDADYIYGWNNERIIRFRLSKSGIRMYRRFPNMLKNAVKGIVAAGRFIICRTDTELVSICNAHGFILDRSSAPGLRNAMSSVIDGKVMVTLIFGNKIEIWEYSQMGVRNQLVWSMEQSEITGCSRGASSLIYKSKSGTNWIARLTPEAKLERLVNNGELAVASEFARRYNLDSDLIHKSELRQLVKDGKNFGRVRELTEMIPDIEFLSGLPFETPDLVMRAALLEHVASLPGDDDAGYYDEFRQMMLDEMDDADNHPELEMLKILKKSDFSELVNFVYKHAEKLNDEIGRQIIRAIPKSATSTDLKTFISTIVPLFVRTIPIVARNDLARWIADRAVNFHQSEPNAWPANAIDLINAYCSNLPVPAVNALWTGTGKEITMLAVITELNNKLKEIGHFKTDYSLDMPLDALDNPEKKDGWILATLHDRLLKSKNRRECERTLSKLVTPVSTECNIDFDHFLARFLDAEDGIALECRVEVIKQFKTDETKKQFLKAILENLEYPWPAYLFEYATSVAKL